MSNRKIKKCKHTSDAAFVLKILTNFYSKCFEPCGCFLPGSCDCRGVVEKYFADNIKPVFEALLGENNFEYGVCVYEHGDQYMFRFFIYVSKESVVKKCCIIQTLKNLRRYEKKITKYHISRSGK